MAALGCSAFKLSTFEVDPVRFPRIDHGEMREAFAEIARTGRMAAIHNEDQEIVTRLIAAAKAAGRTGPEMHAATRPPLAERLANLAVFELGLASGCHVHLAHSSLAVGFEQAAARTRRRRAGKRGKLPALPVPDGGALLSAPGLAKCNPAARASGGGGILAALLAGRVAYVSTDHAPWPLARRALRGGYLRRRRRPDRPAILRAIVLHPAGRPRPAAHADGALRRRTPGALPRGVAEERRAVARVGCGSVHPGARRLPLDARRIEDREEHRWSVWDGWEMRARVAETWLRGRRVWDGERVLGQAGDGRFVPRVSDAPVDLPDAPR